MIYGKNAWDNANLSSDEVLNLISEDNWNDNNIESFINFWSNVIYITIDGMEKRIDNVFRVLTNLNPSFEDVKKSLKTKSPRWQNAEVNRISNLIFLYMQRRNELTAELLHQDFQNELNDIGPVYTVWSHYLLNPLIYPPIDKFNFTAYSFITSNTIRFNVPQNFSYPFANSDYNNFQEWFISIIRNYKGVNYVVKDIVSLDKALMSLGAFIQKIKNRTT